MIRYYLMAVAFVMLVGMGVALVEWTRADRPRVARAVQVDGGWWLRYGAGEMFVIDTRGVTWTAVSSGFVGREDYYELIVAHPPQIVCKKGPPVRIITLEDFHRDTGYLLPGE